MKKIEVGIKDNPYQVIVGSNLINQENLQILKDREVLLVLDQNIPSEFKDMVTNDLTDLSSKFHTLEILASEENKNGATLDTIHSKLITKKYSRDCCLVGLGGGITCDITGFAAATYQRGVNFILIPSTLLSQVDASVGGKTGVNNEYGKNLIGSFMQPDLVISDISILKSLPKREIICGYGEILKHSIISNKKFFIFLNKNIKKVLNLSTPFIEKTIYES